MIYALSLAAQIAAIATQAALDARGIPRSVCPAQCPTCDSAHNDTADIQGSPVFVPWLSRGGDGLEVDYARDLADAQTFDEALAALAALREGGAYGE